MAGYEHTTQSTETKLKKTAYPHNASSKIWPPWE